MDRQDEKLSLNPQQADYVHRQVESGRFASPSEVINEALRRMKDSEDSDAADVSITDEEIRRQVEEGAAAADRGEFLDGEAVMDELDELDRSERTRKKAS